MYSFHSSSTNACPSPRAHYTGMYTPPNAEACYFPLWDPSADLLQPYFPAMPAPPAYPPQLSYPPPFFPPAYPQYGEQRCLGLPATTALAPGIAVPRRKPTILSSDPNQPLLYCKFCLQPFSRRNSLRRHELLHTGLKVYKCYPCARSFSRQDIFKRHCASRRCQRLTSEAAHC